VFDYASLWTPLLEQAARIENSTFKIKLENKFPLYTYEPLSMDVIAAQQEPTLKNDGTSLPLHEDVVIDDYWHGKTWAGESGWHRLTIENDSTQLNYYVSNSKEWQSLRIAQQQTANRLLNQSSNRSHEMIDSKEHKPISLLLFFFVFLVAAGFLWLVPKL
jgi:hypothetical protein